MNVKTMYPVIENGKIVANGGNYVDDIYSNVDDKKKRAIANKIKNITDTTGNIAGIFNKKKPKRPLPPPPKPTAKKGMSNLQIGLLIGIPVVIIGGALLWKKFGKKG